MVDLEKIPGVSLYHYRPEAPYACLTSASRGRLIREEESRTRSMFQRDRDRIIHCVAFRRLKAKTQVFVYHVGDNFRTRLTHSLEVAQIARSLARVLGLDEDLAESVALAHDLGHPPFGHAGEEALQDCMNAYDGFDHNAQTLRIVTKLETRYAEFDGLNLAWETLEGIVKHNGPLIDGPLTANSGLPAAILEYCEVQDLQLHTYASLEAQIAALADDIAYNNHDLDDGLRAGLFTLDDLMDLPIVGDTLKQLRMQYPDTEDARISHEAVRRLISHLVRDVLDETTRRLSEAGVKSVEDVRAADRPMVSFSEATESYDKAIRSFLFENMYRHYSVNRTMSKARRVVKDLFDLFIDDPSVLPTSWRRRCTGPKTPKTARVVCDYIAGMTDRYALEEHRRLFSVGESGL